MPDRADPSFIVDPETARSRDYDVVVVGSGVSGSLIAKQVSRAGGRVLVVEAGHGDDITVAQYEESVQRFYGAVSKDSNAAYAHNPNAAMPRGFETQKLLPGRPNANGYFVQNGPFEIDSTYSRVLGGTTRHWEAKALRMLPDDFALRERFGQGVDWPVSYDELGPWYAEAEAELGVSGDVEDQTYCGITFPEGYVLPMRRMPPSWLDQQIARELDGTEVTLAGESYPIYVRSTPQARNGIPNPAYDGGKGYRPTGAVSIHQAEMGERCQGNTNCVPICPVQAKYDARRTLFAALRSGRVDLLPKSVASKVTIDEVSGRVTEVEVRCYRDGSPEHVTVPLRGKIFVLAANAVENARLMLASGLKSSSGLMGRNLMDHAYLLTWGLMPQIVGTLRGPLCTSGIEDLRTGSYRNRQAAFRMSIHNDGWGWATSSPYSDLDEMVDRKNKFGAALRAALLDRIGRQLLLDCMVEVLPEESNRISVDPRYVDQLGNPRPVIDFAIPAYTMEAAAAARRITKLIYQRLGVEDYTDYSPNAYGYVNYEGEDYVIRGGNHWAGTHIMGSDPKRSVVDDRQKSWDHKNLYLVGAGSMCSIGTANTTLTLSALCLRSAVQITSELGLDAGATQQSGGSAWA